MIRSAALVAMTGSLPNWPIESLELGPLVLGPGAETYLEGIEVHGPHADGMSTIRGADCIRFLGRFGAVILWHWPAEHILAAIRRASRVPGGTKVSIALAYENISLVKPWDGRSLELWYFLSALRFESSRLNSAGSRFIDYYEGLPGKDHVAAVDISKPGFDLAMAEVVGRALDNHYATTPPDSLFLDCCQERRYWGSATNVDRDDPLYQPSTDAIVRAIQGRHAPVIGNNPGNAYRNTLFHRMDEAHWRRYPGEAVRAIQADMLAGGVSYLGVESRSSWAKRPDPWREFCGALGVYMPRVYAITCRTGSAFSLFSPGSDLVEVGG
jgi:hypothetical protein